MTNEHKPAPIFRLMAREFPGYDQSTLPVIPHYWQDTSWHNDASPSFSATPSALAGTGVYVWIDYADPALREFPPEESGGRFGCYLQDDSGARIMERDSDDWGAILRTVENMSREWDAIRAVNVAQFTETFSDLCAQFLKWAEENNRPEGDAMDNLMCEDNSPAQQAWLSDFIRRWDDMEETVRELESLLRSADKYLLTEERCAAMRAAILKIEAGR